MNREQLIRAVEESGLDDNLKKTIILVINQAYDAGFSDGMKRGAELQSQVSDMFLSKT
jgi:hypothetical protein